MQFCHQLEKKDDEEQSKGLKNHEKQSERKAAPFVASEGWSHNWKKTFGVHQLNVCGGKLSARNEKEEIYHFTNGLHKIVEKKGLTGEQFCQFLLMTSWICLKT